MGEVFEEWRIWGKHVILTLKRFEERFEKNEREADELKNDIRREFGDMKEFISSKTQGLSKEFNRSKLEQSNDLTSLKVRLALYSTIFGGGIALFFTALFPWLIKVLGF